MNKSTFATFVFSLFLGYTQSLFAQVDNPFFADNSHTIFLPKKTVLYVSTSSYDAKWILEQRNSGEWNTFNSVPSKSLLRKVKVAQNSEVPVIGFIKSNFDLDYYDYYLVEYNGKVCYLSREFCNDNTLIDTKNKQIHDYYKSLQKDIEKLSNDFLNGVKTKAQLAYEELAVLNKRKSFIVDSIAKSRIAEQEEDMLNQYRKWEANLDAAGKKATKKTPDPQGKRRLEDGGGDCSNIPTSQGLPASRCWKRPGETSIGREMCKMLLMILFHVTYEGKTYFKDA